MLDLTRQENREALQKLGFPDSLIEKLHRKQKNGEKIAKFAHLTDNNGNRKIVAIPESPEEIEEKKNIDKRRHSNQRLRKEQRDEQDFPLDEFSELPEIKKLKLEFFKRIKDDINFKGSCWIWVGDPTTQDVIKKESYEIFKKKIIDDSKLSHRCENSKCINPNHLYPIKT